MKLAKRMLYVLILFLIGPVLVVACAKVNLSQDWRNADRSSQNIAPSPAAEAQAVVQVYAARAFSWRGIFAVHAWISTKPEGATEYTVHQVIGWNEWREKRVVVADIDFPDRSWYGNSPELLADIRGQDASRLIPKIFAAAESYPHQYDYTLWPGPNSNSFVAHVAREVPELRLKLPTTAIGKDYLVNGGFFDSAPSGTGWQVSLIGVVGLTLAIEEGLEINLLSANFGIEPFGPAIKLPGYGRIGF
ncbi:MAG: hypothetical protein ACI9BW_001419 [Gammaproteobacteria bacterium]|jgi:hypothetical protein